MKVRPLTIRPARPGDQTALAKVHIQTWQEAYKDILSQDYLEKLPTELDCWIKMWTEIIANTQRWVWVAEASDDVIGFVILGPPRDPDREDFIELGAIYLLASEKKKGIGFSLLSTGFNKMKDLGYKKSYCWALETNPTVNFYIKSGAALASQVKMSEIGGQMFKEIALEWHSLSLTRKNHVPFSDQRTE